MSARLAEYGWGHRRQIVGVRFGLRIERLPFMSTGERHRLAVAVWCPHWFVAALVALVLLGELTPVLLQWRRRLLAPSVFGSSHVG